MKKRKGFTLIELLAVIVVLSIIALIAMPIIFNVIEKAKLKSLENSAYGVVDAVMLQYMKNLKDGNVSLTGSVTTLSLKGEQPTGGTWEIVNDADAAGGKGIKISGVTYASMEGYVCNSEEDENKNLTGKVICLKDNFIFIVTDNAINDKGWAKEDINVKVTAEGVSNLKYCIDDEECTPNQDVTSNGINITTEGSTYLCVQGDNTKVRCNLYNIDKQAPTLTVKTATPTIIVGESIEIITYLEEPTYGVSNGVVVCKTNESEITNTSGLAVGTHAVTCNAIGNNGLSSSDALVTVKVEKFIRLAVDANSNRVAELGDEVCIGNECFYVLTNDGTNIRMLAKYGIDASDNTARKDRLQNTGTLTTVFSNETVKGTNPNSYEGSIVEDLVGDYKTTLEGLGATISEATLLSYDEVTEAPFNCTTTSGSCNPTYSWLYADYHWTRSAYSGNIRYVWNVRISRNVNNQNCNNTLGVRPVITIATSALN